MHRRTILKWLGVLPAALLLPPMPPLIAREGLRVLVPLPKPVEAMTVQSTDIGHGQLLLVSGGLSYMYDIRNDVLHELTGFNEAHQLVPTE